MAESTDSSFEFPHRSPTQSARAQEIHTHQLQVETMLAETHYDGLLLTEPDNFAWFTTGGDLRHATAWQPPPAALFISHSGRVLLTASNLGDKLLAGDLEGLGFQLKQRRWHAEFLDLLDEVTRGRRVLSDSGFGRTRQDCVRVDQLRQKFSKWRNNQFAALTHTHSATLLESCRQITPGQNLDEIRSQLLSRIISAGGWPIQMELTTPDDSRTPQAGFHTAETFTNLIEFQLVVRQSGLHIPLSGLIANGPLNERHARWIELAQCWLATAIELSQADLSWREIWLKLQEQIDPIPIPGDGQVMLSAHQLGYRYSEQEFWPYTHGEPARGTLCRWNITVGTIHLAVITVIGFDETVSNSGLLTGWPCKSITTDAGTAITVPDILPV